MGPELKKLESPSAGTGLETPGQQCPPNEGTWDQGRTTADGFLTVGVDSNRGNIFSPTTKSVDTRAGTKSTKITADITFLEQGHKPRDEKKGSKENKQFDPGGKGEKAPLWNAAVTLPFLSVESVGSWETHRLQRQKGPDGSNIGSTISCRGCFLWHSSSSNNYLKAPQLVVV